MENASFTIDTSDWKSFYKMKYNGEKASLIAFSSLVSGTCGVGALKLEPKALEVSKAIAEKFSGLGEELTKLNRSTRSMMKKEGIEKNKYLEMFILQQALQILGAKTCLEKKELKKTLKDI